MIKILKHTLEVELDSIERMLMHTELTVMAGDHESYNISAPIAKRPHQSRNKFIDLTIHVN